MNNAAAVLDQNGIAITAGDITVYNYDAETVYLSATVEYLAYGVGIPAHSCIDAPPENAPASVCRYRPEHLEICSRPQRRNGLQHREW